MLKSTDQTCLSSSPNQVLSSIPFPTLHSTQAKPKAEPPSHGLCLHPTYLPIVMAQRTSLEPLPRPEQGPLGKGPSRDNLLSCLKLLWPGSISSPGASWVPQPPRTCAAQMDARRARLRPARCVLPARSLCNQFVCLPQPFVQDF